METGQVQDFETLFNQTIKEIIPHLDRFDVSYDAVIGIPFYNEKESLIEILQLIADNPHDLPSPSTLVVCCGDPIGEEIVDAIQGINLAVPHFAFVMKPGANGRGASVRALLEIANHLESDLVLMASDLKQEQGRGFKLEWIKQMAVPIKSQYDLTLVNFYRHHLEDLPGRLFTRPLLENFYGYQVTDPHSGIYAISHDLVEDLCQDIKFWPEITRSYGIDSWLITRALSWDKRICEINLGAKLAHVSKEKINHIFKETAASLFECITRDSKLWLNREPVIRHLDIYGKTYYLDTPEETFFSFADLMASFKENYTLYERLSNTLLPSEIVTALQETLSASSTTFSLDHQLWTKVVYHYLLGYAFKKDISRNDLFNGLTNVFNGRMAHILAMVEMIEIPPATKKEEYELFQVYIFDSLKKQQHASFLDWREIFKKKWQQKAHETRPPITPAHYMEFIPGAPLLLPKKLTGSGGITVYAEEIFNRMENQYQERFDRFVHEKLNLPVEASSDKLVNGITDFMHNVEDTFSTLMPGDLYSEEGIKEVLEGLFSLLPVPHMLSVKDEILQKLLLNYPPMNVMIPLGCKSPRELLEKVDVRDAFSLASLIENPRYVEKAQQWILENLHAEAMEEVIIRPLVLGAGTEYASYNLLTTGNFNKLATRIVVSPFSKGMGGEYPFTYFCLSVAHQIALSGNLSRLWRVYTREKKHLGQKVGNSLSGWYRARTFSVHNIFENSHHRLMVNTLQAMANTLEAIGKGKESEAIRLLAESYGLSQVLENGVFLPCSASTWSTYSYKGGEGVPTPLSAEVEEKWFNHDFLEELYISLGYDPNEIDNEVVQLIGEGKGSDDLLDVALGIVPEDVIAVPQDTVDAPPAVPLTRYPENPLLRPIKEHYWESKYVLNAAAIKIQDLVYILYRAFGDDEISRIGLAISDGYRILERIPEPIFGPEDESEKKGCEDPRIVIIDDELYMLYTAYNGTIAQIAAASISIDDFLNRRFDRWERKGLAFQDIWDKDAIIFPEKIDGRYVIYHRIEPSIWVSYLDKLEFPAPKEQHSVILGPRLGRMWDSLKIGAGTQPIKTEYGWLMIYHGVDRNRVYRLGVILVDLNNPERVLYRSPNPVLSPETEYEIGMPGEHWVPNVVFTCGAVPKEEKEVLEAEDEIIVYYGAADAYLCAATGKIGDLIPEEVRRHLQGTSNA